MENSNETPMSLFTVTEVELIYRNKTSPADRKTIRSADTAYDVFLSTWDMNKIDLLEQFKIILLDNSSKCLGVSSLASGGVASCVVDPRIVFSTALTARATSIILAHNHPSGNLQPSDSDIAMTGKMIACGDLMEIKVSDHLIVTARDYYSMRNNNWPFPSFK